MSTTPTPTLPDFSAALAAYKTAQATLATDASNDQTAAAELATATAAKAGTAQQLAADTPLAYAAGQTLIDVITVYITPLAPLPPTT